MYKRETISCEGAGCQASYHGSDDPYITTTPMCHAHSKNGYGCTQPRGHEGLHVACCCGEAKAQFGRTLTENDVHVTWEDGE
jgi:hypothetical protein